MSQTRRSSDGRGSCGGTPSDKALERYTNAQVEDMVNQCVHALLVLSQKGMPVKRADITKLVCQGNSRTTKPIVKKAEVKLRKIFGLRLGHSEDLTKYYISNVNSDFMKSLNCIPDEVLDEQFILFVVLSAIEMSNNSEIGEPDLLVLLSKIGLHTEEHAKKFLDRFHRQEFLITEKKKANDEELKFYKWGERADFQVDKRKLYEHFKGLYGSEVKKLPEDTTENGE